MAQSTKVTTVIDNRTKEVLVLKVGNQNYFAKLGTIEVGAQYKVELDVNWTYQEFSLQPVKGRGRSKIVVSSDDCCDFERLTVTESGGKFEVEKVARGQSSASAAAAELVTKNWRRYFTWPKLQFNWRFWM